MQTNHALMCSPVCEPYRTGLTNAHGVVICICFSVDDLAAVQVSDGAGCSPVCVCASSTCQSSHEKG